ncbi:MAG TPA: FHA domain-containing protein [Desulfobacterales bacterium]|nr:FHA domain-containing protein [Desulfobacterales bacterium]
MKTAPVIIVQLIHIEGPLKGQILELSDPEIKIGRQTSCQLCFPADLNIISREHATITREGNRFKLTDHSSNGTLVNGKRIQEIYLKDGDVITIAQGGPKVSFLTEIGEADLSSPAPAPEIQRPAPPSPPPVREEIVKPIVPKTHQVQKPVPPPVSVPPAAAPPAARNKEPLIIQYGPTLRTFDELPLRIGKNPDNNFSLEHPGIQESHAEIYFAGEQYWIRDLTGRQLITVNGVAVDQGAALGKNDKLALSPEGPFFQFLGNGRLVEEASSDEEVSEQSGRQEDGSASNKPPDKEGRKPMSFLKKIMAKI